VKAKSIKGTSPEEIKIGIKEENMKDGFAPTLAIAFLQSSKTVRYLPDIGWGRHHIFGCIHHGGFIDGEVEFGKGAILLMDLNRTIFKFNLDESPKKKFIVK